MQQCQSDAWGKTLAGTVASVEHSDEAHPSHPGTLHARLIDLKTNIASYKEGLQKCQTRFTWNGGAHKTKNHLEVLTAYSERQACLWEQF